MSKSVGILALSVKYPSVMRTNDFWRKNHPEMVANAEQLGLGKIWTVKNKPRNPSELFDSAMRPYLSDPFRGTVGRRVLGPDETGLSIETEAVKLLLEAASMSTGDVDYLISVGFQPDSPGCGNGVYIAGNLDLSCPAINLETCCTGTIVAFQTACALVSSGQVDNVVISLSCTYSIQCEPSNNLSWTTGDGAGALLVGRVDDGYGFLGGKIINTANTVGAMYFELVVDEPKTPRIRAGINRIGSRVLRETALPFLMTCVDGACRKAQIAIKDIDFFVFHTPMAWFSSFCADALNIDPNRTINTFELYGNTGPALTTGNLYHALIEKKINPGDLVLIYSPGSISSSSAVVVRWTETKLGPPPEPPKIIE